MDMAAFEAALDADVAAVMLTCPNTLGIFNPHIHEIAELAHAADALVYYDGANLNACWAAAGRATSGSTSCTSTCTRPSPRRTAAAGPAPGPVGVEEPAGALPADRVVVKRTDGTYALDYDRAEVHRLHRAVLRQLRRRPARLRLHAPAGPRGAAARSARTPC